MTIPDIAISAMKLAQIAAEIQDTREPANAETVSTSKFDEEACACACAPEWARLPDRC
jgi:CXCXC repeat